jgi:hypothetical protein
MPKKAPKERPEATQQTQPKKGKPIEIPIPTESQIARDFTKIATAKHDDEDED